MLTTRAQAEQIYADLSATGCPGTGRRRWVQRQLCPHLVAQFQARSPAIFDKGRPAAGTALPEVDPRAL